MNKTKFLAALALPALLAACSQEAIVENASNVDDLSSREVIENVVLNFGDGNIDSRAGLGTSSWNSYAWTSEDGVGACVIDVLNSSGGLDIVENISTNYKYYFSSEGQWKTDALMVKGNYMFYAPYNAAHMGRNNIEAVLPTTQNVKVQAEDNNAIAEFYASGKPVFVGYKKLEGKSTETKISVDMRHIFAYPLFTIVNKYDTRTPSEILNNVAPKYQDIKIVKVELSLPSPAKFNYHLIAKNANVEAKLKTATSGTGLVWDATKHEDNSTEDIFPTAKTDAYGNDLVADKITMNLGEGFTLKGTEKLSFHAVMPAMEYTNGIVVTAYDADGNYYTVASGKIAQGVNLNPGYRFPAQEYTTDGEVMSSKGTLLTAELSKKNQAPTEIGNNDDFIAYLKSRNSRFNALEQVALGTTAAANEFQLQASANIKLNTEVIDALANYCMTDASVTFTAANVAIATDVTVVEANATATSGIYEFVIKSANNKTFKVIMPATEITANTNLTAKGTYVVSNGTVTTNIANGVFPINVVVTGTGELTGATHAKLTSLNVVDGATLTLSNKYDGPIVVNQGTLTINSGIVVTSTIKNTGTINNSGVMYAETNINSGTINAVTSGSVTKVASGTGTINNTILAAVKASANQTVKWEGTYVKIYDSTNVAGLSEADNSKTGINHVTITDATITTSAAILAAPVKGCDVNFVVLKNATQLTTAKGGNLAGFTLVFDQSCSWTGDILGAPEFTNATVRVKDGKTVTVEYAIVSGTQDKSVAAYDTGVIKGDNIGGVANF